MATKTTQLDDITPIQLMDNDYSIIRNPPDGRPNYLADGNCMVVTWKDVGNEERWYQNAHVETAWAPNLDLLIYIDGTKLRDVVLVLPSDLIMELLSDLEQSGTWHKHVFTDD